MSFSKRMGMIGIKKIQLDSIDIDLKNGLWNAFYLHIRPYLLAGENNYTRYKPRLFRYACVIWADLFKAKLDYIPNSASDCLKVLRDKYNELSWNQIYDFIELTIYAINLQDLDTTNYIKECNRVLEKEFSGYRLINNLITPISNEIEISAIEETIESSTTSVNVTFHLKSALNKLSDRTNPDYRNSIKESISAVETLCREITGENTLGKAINKFEKSGIIFNQQFKDALEKLYAYTNNKETGIRHALLENGQMPDFDEAKFMVVACSAFINYLISKQTLIN